MANTYTQLHIHVVFAVHGRVSLIGNGWKDELYKYITGIIQKQGHRLLSIGGMPDHIHILFGFRPNQSLSVLVQNIKRDSSIWINQNRFVRGKFAWQKGYGAFSYSKSHVSQVIRYIMQQEKHHEKRSFIEEYIKILQDFDIEYNEKYIFTSILL